MNSISIRFSKFPFSYVRIIFRSSPNTTAMLHAVNPLTIIYLSIVIIVNSNTFWFTIYELSIVSTSILKFLKSSKKAKIKLKYNLHWNGSLIGISCLLAMFHIILPHSFIKSTIIVYHQSYYYVETTTNNELNLIITHILPIPWRFEFKYYPKNTLCLYLFSLRLGSINSSLTLNAVALWGI